MESFALVIVATVVAIVHQRPRRAFLAASSATASAIIRPILDFMQTMPAMVYLIPGSR